MKAIEASAKVNADKLSPLVYADGSQLIACTPALVGAAVFAAATYVAVAFRTGYDAAADQHDAVDPGSEQMTVGDLLHVLRESR
ncbi:hypothetical protein [Amycolatopsis sp. H20-H5]|uniref:hypothetical protein n=1 Tax=Amycolatopsis sp. H20-H5 TaxID=3046309 RepID=UPI002DBB77AA|nr:hypothetical protein [Amycolatopsis sp. H20-H5]MEC3975489.1 hypothetical protein [Amycolatopsis sp. H20-H5]